MHRTCRVVTLGLVLVYGHYRLSVTYGLEFCSLENKVLGVEKFLLKWRKMETGSRKKVLFQNFWRSKSFFIRNFLASSEVEVLISFEEKSRMAKLNPEPETA